MTGGKAFVVLVFGLSWAMPACGAVYIIGETGGGRDGGGTTGGAGCAPGEIVCGGACLDPARTALHCGGCGRACDPTEVCVEGTCVDPCAGQECEPEVTVCVEGDCSCRFGLSPCGETCVDLQSNVEHCGSCGNACADGQVCARGMCRQPPCPAGLALCEDQCVDLSGDPLHCGSCEDACEAGRVCVQGECRELWPSPCGSCPCAACDPRVCCDEAGGVGAACVDGSTCPNIP